MTIALLKKISNKSIKNAGPRYTPNFDKLAPNLKIDTLITALEYLAREENLTNTFKKFLEELLTTLNPAETNNLSKYIKSKKCTIDSVVNGIKNYLKLNPSDYFNDLSSLRKSVNHICRALETRRANLWRKYEKEKGEKKNQLSSEIHTLNKATSLFYELNNTTNSKYLDLCNTPLLLICGDAGTGKTHFLCDLAQKKLNNNKPVLMVLAQEIEKVTDPLAQIAEKTGFAKNKKSLLDKLTSLSRKSKERALIIIDGLNEGDFQGWKEYFRKIKADLKPYPNIGLVISIRTPYESNFCEYSRQNKIPKINHYGFNDIEFDATTEFFNYYKIPTPDYPLLDSEFTNPLFLKIACETLQQISSPLRKRSLNEIASGAKTITTLFEDYVAFISANIEKKYTLKHKTCWNIIKGKGIEIKKIKMDIGIATTMAHEGREWTYPEELKDIIQKHTNFTEEKLDNFYADFISLSIIVPGIRWQEQNKDIFRLPYQRISDHIISRSLLKNNLAKIHNKSDIRKQLQENTTLGKVFHVNNIGRYEKPNLATAIIMDFPEYVKRHVNDNDREIIKFLPKENNSLQAFYEPFLKGLIWRHNNNFSTCTSYYCQILLECNAPHASSMALDVLSNIATRKDHIYNGKRLYGYLSKLSLTARDLFWTEFLRKNGLSVKDRLMKWLSANDLNRLDRQSVDNFLYVIALFLTTTNEHLRDKATKLIFDLGLVFPKLLFLHTLESLESNDPYVTERMLAASYGVAMRLYFKKQNIGDLLAFSKEIFKAMFDNGHKYSTTHCITRDYAAKVIELAEKTKPSTFTLSQLNKAKPPYSKMGIKNWYKLPAQEGAFPLHYEFRKDFIAQIANNHDRYNFNNPNQIATEGKILWRIHQLGYTEEKFKSIDEEIMRYHSYNYSKNVKSYSEKYTYISYYELLGHLYDKHFITLEKLSGSKDRIEVKIDPSFPTTPHEPNFVANISLRKSKNLGRWVNAGGVPNIEPYLKIDHLKGIDGKAILLGGSIFKEDKNLRKRIAINIRGIFIKNSRKDEALKKLRNLSLDNLHIPDNYPSLYLYAGEIPWCSHFDLSSNDHISGTKHTKVKKRNGTTLHSTYSILDEEIEMPTSEYSWSTNACHENRVGSALILSKNIIDHFNLLLNPEGMNFYTTDHHQVSHIIKGQQEDSFYNHHQFLYFSERELSQYLDKNNFSLVWIIYGERGISFDKMHPIEKCTEECVYKRFKLIRSYK